MDYRLEEICPRVSVASDTHEIGESDAQVEKLMKLLHIPIYENLENLVQMLQPLGTTEVELRQKSTKSAIYSSKIRMNGTTSLIPAS